MWIVIVIFLIIKVCNHPDLVGSPALAASALWLPETPRHEAGSCPPPLVSTAAADLRLPLHQEQEQSTPPPPPAAAAAALLSAPTTLSPLGDLWRPAAPVLMKAKANSIAESLYSII